jgi:hypothetical protein
MRIKPIRIQNSKFKILNSKFDVLGSDGKTLKIKQKSGINSTGIQEIIKSGGNHNAP